MVSLLSFASVLAPGLAAEEPERFVHDGAFEGGSVYPMGRAQSFEIELDAGDTISAMLTTDDALVDFDLFFYNPSDRCGTDLDETARCLIECRDDEFGELPFIPEEESFTRTAAVDGTHVISVMFQTGLGQGTYPYVLDVTGRGAETTRFVGERENTFAVRVDHCSALEALGVL